MSEKSKELNSSIKLVNDKLHFTGTVAGIEPLSIDYYPPLGDDLGYTSLELLLLSFSSCVGSAVLTFLRRMKKTITDFEIQTKGLRHEEHPTGFKSIHLNIIMSSSDVSDEDLQKVIDMSEEKYCPVWAMLKGNTIVETSFVINR